jgi:hypothetical protein
VLLWLGSEQRVTHVLLLLKQQCVLLKQQTGASSAGTTPNQRLPEYHFCCISYTTWLQRLLQQLLQRAAADPVAAAPLALLQLWHH